MCAAASAVLGAALLAAGTRSETLCVLPGVAVVLETAPRIGGVSCETLDWCHAGPLIINEVCKLQRRFDCMR
jgi:hypothetical protein